MTLTVACPKTPCPQKGFANPGELAGHLVTEHLMAGSAALALARQTAGEVRQAAETKVHQPSAVPKEETAMPREKMTTGTCGFCKRERPDHTPGCRLRPGGPIKTPRAAKKRKPITRRHPLAPSKNGTGLLTELDAFRTVATALEPLEITKQVLVIAATCKFLGIDPKAVAA